MPIDSSIADLAWLTQPGDAGSNLARGAAVGGHIAQFRAQNASLAQRAQQFEQQQALAKQELALQIAQAPLKQTLLQQDAAMNQAKLELFLQGRQDTANATQAFAGLASQVSPLLAEGKIDEAQSALMAAGASNAFLLNDPRFKSLYDFTTKANEAKLELLKARTGFDTTPELKVLTDKKTGKEFPVVTMPGSHAFQVLDPEKDALTKRAMDLREKRLQQDLPPATKAELKDLYDQIKTKRAKLDELPEMTGMVWNRVPNPKRAALQAEIDALRVKAESLGRGATAATPSAPSTFEIGKTYTDAQGNKAIYRGDGNWTPLP